MLTVAEFQDSTVVAIPQRATPFCDIDQDACMASPAPLAKLPEKGKIFSFTMSILLEKQSIASICTATIMVPHHELLLPSHVAFISIEACVNDTVYFVGIDDDAVSGIADNNKSKHLRMSYILLTSSSSIVASNHNILDCRRACVKTCEKQYVIGFRDS